MKTLIVVLGIDGGVVQGGIVTADGNAADGYKRALLVDAYGEELTRRYLDATGEDAIDCPGDYEVWDGLLEVCDIADVQVKIAEMAQARQALP